MSSTEILNDLFGEIQKRDLSLDFKTVPENNVFSVLDIVRKEVPYCKVMLYLIRGNWQSFEREVLNGCCGGEKLVHSECKYFCESPCKEYNREGRIDIFLETENCVAAIETKVNASDQEHQLIRYWIELRKSFANKKCFVFYLTKTGYKAAAKSAVRIVKLSIMKSLAFRRIFTVG